MQNKATPAESRCRLILVVPVAEGIEGKLADAIEGGDVASVILAAESLSETDYSRDCQTLVPVIQERNVAALVVGDSVAAGRSGADGIVFEQPGNDFRDVAARFSPHKIVGFAGAFTRHRALELAEAEPDFLYFGKTDGDIRPRAHPKNLALGAWWSQMVQIPCAVMAGNSIESIGECAASGAEFVAVRRAVFDHVDGARAAVAAANRILDQNANLLDEI